MITIILDDGGRITTDENINAIDVEGNVKHGHFMTIKNLDDDTSVDFPASKISRIVHYHTSSERKDECKHDRKLEFPSTGDDMEDKHRSFQDFKKAWEDALKKDDEKDTIIKKPAKGKLD